MFYDMLLVLIAIASASGVVAADSANVFVMAVLCAIIFSASIFWMGVRSERNN